jgi:hypothetical protein
MKNDNLTLIEEDNTPSVQNLLYIKVLYQLLEEFKEGSEDAKRVLDQLARIPPEVLDKYHTIKALKKVGVSINGKRYNKKDENKFHPVFL